MAATSITFTPTTFDVSRLKLVQADKEGIWFLNGSEDEHVSFDVGKTTFPFDTRQAKPYEGRAPGAPTVCCNFSEAGASMLEDLHHWMVKQTAAIHAGNKKRRDSVKPLLNKWGSGYVKLSNTCPQPASGDAAERFILRAIVWSPADPDPKFGGFTDSLSLTATDLTDA